MIRKLLATFVLLTMIAAPLTVCAADSQPPVKVSVALLYLVADAGIFIAIERGYFKAQGIEVELQRTAGVADFIPMLATSKIDVASGSATPGLFNAFNRGVDAQIVSSKATIHAPYGSGAIYVRKDLVDDHVVKTLADLRGKKIAVNSIQSTSVNYIVRGLAKAKLGLNDVTLVEMPFSQYVPALAKKAVDAVLAVSPIGDAVVNQGLAVEFPDSRAIVTSNNAVVNLMLYSPGFAQTPAAQRFMTAHLQGMRDYYRAIIAKKGGKLEVCGILHKYLPELPPDCGTVTMSYVDPNGALNVESLEKFQSEWVQYGIMTKYANIPDHVNLKFLNAAIHTLGRYKD